MKASLYLPHEIERFFYRGGCRLLRATERERFIAAGVAQIDLAIPDMVLAAPVVFFEQSFAFPDELDDPQEGTPAFVMICRDSYGDAIDLAAWAPSMERLATWLGRAWAIDEFRLMRPRLAESEALPVHKSPLEWLRARRDGIVIIDGERARWQIAYLGRSLIVEDVSHGRTLRQALTMPEPQIFVSPSSVDMCAA
jgi:hypothetical protein